MPDSKIHLFGSFFLLWRCFWLLITIFHRSLSLSWRSITSPITTFLLLRMRDLPKWWKIGPIFWDPFPFQQFIQFIHISLLRANNWTWSENRVKILNFLKRANVKLNWFFGLWRESDHTNLLIFWESLVHVKGRQYSHFEQNR